MGIMTAPDVGSGSCPAWIASVSSPSFLAVMRSSYFLFEFVGEFARRAEPRGRVEAESPHDRGARVLGEVGPLVDALDAKPAASDFEETARLGRGGRDR